MVERADLRKLYANKIVIICNKIRYRGMLEYLQILYLIQNTFWII